MIIEIKKISELTPAPYNPRESTEKQESQLKQSLKKFGVVEPIIYNKQTGYIVGGHFRVRELQKLGYTEIECVIVDLSEEDEKELNIRLNANTGQWDWDELANNFELDDLNDWGLEVPNMKHELEAEDDNFEEPENIETDIVLGDLFEIGEHRLLCGDSTDSDSVARLMDGEKADMVFTDPPYGISHSGKGITAPTKSGKIVEGNNFGEILGDGNVNAAIDSFNLIYSLYPDALHIWWGANYYSSVLPNGFGWLVWDKERVGDTFSGAELAFVNKGVKVDVFRHMWHGIAKASESGDKRLHPTQKPVALVEWCFNNYQAGNLILDLFLGSGSTMVASHQLKRKCYGMELDPKYCQVIIDRMKKLDPTIKIKRNGVEL
jgi:16S rRNA G966 N2-methylase RsmD